jgi:hypothetical protein
VFCTDTSSVGRIFDSRLSYSKGALVLHMLRWVIGDEAFFTGIRNYLNDQKLSYGFALTADLKSHMEATSGKDLTEFFNDWLYGEGYPSYFIQVGQSGDNTVGLIIEQDQSHESVSFFEMPVPVRFYGNGTDTTFVFNNTMSGEAFWCNPGFKFDSAKFDPDMWIVSWQNFVSLSKDDDIPAGSVLSLVPNPASDLLKIKHNLGLLRSAEVFSLGGQKAVATIQQNESGLCTLNTSKLASGFYLLRMKFDNLVVLRKFIVER